MIMRFGLLLKMDSGYFKGVHHGKPHHRHESRTGKLTRCWEPPVVSVAGLVFPEGTPDVLAGLLRQLQDTAYMCASLGEKGRARVLDHFIRDQVAAATVDVYRKMVDGG